MKNLDIAVIGSGIGGSLISALNKNKERVMVMKEDLASLNIGILFDKL